MCVVEVTAATNLLKLVAMLIFSASKIYSLEGVRPQAYFYLLRSYNGMTLGKLAWISSMRVLPEGWVLSH